MTYLFQSLYPCPEWVPSPSPEFVPPPRLFLPPRPCPFPPPLPPTVDFVPFPVWFHSSIAPPPHVVAVSRWLPSYYELVGIPYAVGWLYVEVLTDYEIWWRAFQ